jgi:ABC-type transport system substrate-binding protein
MYSIWSVAAFVTQIHAGDINVLSVSMYHTSIDTLDPHVQNTTERYICLMTYEPLVTRYRDTMELVPQLATSWKISDDEGFYFLP